MLRFGRSSSTIIEQWMKLIHVYILGIPASSLVVEPCKVLFIHEYYFEVEKYGNLRTLDCIHIYSIMRENILFVQQTQHLLSMQNSPWTRAPRTLLSASQCVYQVASLQVVWVYIDYMFLISACCSASCQIQITSIFPLPGSILAFCFVFKGCML